MPRGGTVRQTGEESVHDTRFRRQQQQRLQELEEERDDRTQPGVRGDLPEPTAIVSSAADSASAQAALPHGSSVVPIDVESSSALVTTSTVTSAVGFGASSGSPRRTLAGSSQAGVRSPGVQLRVEDSREFEGDVPAARERADRMPELVISPLRTGRQLPRTPVPVPNEPNEPSQSSNATSHESETVWEHENQDFFGQHEDQQPRTSQPLPRARRILPSVYTSRGYVQVGNAAGPSDRRSSIDTSVESDTEELPDPTVTSASYVGATGASTALHSPSHRAGDHLLKSPSVRHQRSSSEQERADKERRDLIQEVREHQAASRLASIEIQKNEQERRRREELVAKNQRKIQEIDKRYPAVVPDAELHVQSTVPDESRQLREQLRLQSIEIDRLRKEVRSVRRSSQVHDAANFQLEEDEERERQAADTRHRLLLADAKRREEEKIRAARRRQEEEESRRREAENMESARRRQAEEDARRSAERVEAARRQAEEDAIRRAADIETARREEEDRLRREKDASYQEMLRQQQRLLDEANARLAQQQSAGASGTQSYALPNVPIVDQRLQESREQTSARAKPGELVGKSRYGMLYRPTSADSTVPLTRVELNAVPMAALGLQTNISAADLASTALVTAVGTISTTTASQTQHGSSGAGRIASEDSRREDSPHTMPKPRTSRYEGYERAGGHRSVGWGDGSDERKRVGGCGTRDRSKRRKNSAGGRGDPSDSPSSSSDDNRHRGKPKSDGRKQYRSTERSRGRKEKKAKKKDDDPSSPSSGSSGDRYTVSDSESSDSTAKSDDSKVRWTKADRKWKNQFPITRSIYKHAEEGRGSTKCDVVRFERGTDTSIVNWIIQMETYFITNSIRRKAWVGLMVGRIAGKHFDEVKPFLALDYCSLRDKLVHIFDEPNTVQSCLHEISRATQDREESISEFMNRLRLLAVKAYPKLTHEQREPILVSAFSRGLVDRGLATYLATMNLQTSAKAERVALAGSTMRSEFKGRRSNGTYCAENVEEFEEEQNSESEEHSESEYEVAAAIPDQRPRGKQFGRVGADRRRISNKRGCFNCGATDHFKADCPKLKSKRSVPYACDICDGPHYLRQCPKWEAVKQLGRKMATPLTGTSSTSGTRGARAETSKSRVPETDDAMVVLANFINLSDGIEAAYPTEDQNSTPRLKLFFVMASVQTMPVWILADSGSARNLMIETFFLGLPFQPPIRPIGDVQVVGGSGYLLDLRGFAILPTTIDSVVLWHEYGFVRELPIDVIIGGDVLIPHQCTLQYIQTQQKKLEFGVRTCSICAENRENPESGFKIQSKFMELTVRKKRNRLKLDPNFLAVLLALLRVCNTVPETRESANGTLRCEESSAEGFTACVKASTHFCPSSAGSVVGVPELVSLPVADATSANSSVPEVPGSLSGGKLQQVLSELKIAALAVPEEIKKKLINLVTECLDAFAASNTDLRRTSIITHTIKTGDSKPFRHKL